MPRLAKLLALCALVISAGDSLAAQVFFDCKPAADAQLIVISPNNEEQELRLDAKGAAHLEKAAPGSYALRARVEQKAPGERDGKTYDVVRHYTTFTFRLPASKQAQSVAVAASGSNSSAARVADPAAKELLRKAREARAVWENFKGFQADVSVTIDGQRENGTVEIDDTGTATVTLADDKLRDWAETQATSLVQHRLPSGFGDENPTFADNETDHPLGRLIRLGESQFDSVYRIRADVVTEVNRHAGPVRFTISVLETTVNHEGKYLPRVFTITTWDEKSGQVKSTTSALNTWKRVGNYDLPERILEVATSPGDRHVREIKFSHFRLSPKSAE